MIPFSLLRVPALLCSLFVFVPPPLSCATPIAILDMQPDATPPAAPAVKTELTPALIETRRTALQKEIALTRANFEQLPAEKSEETSLWLTQEIVLLARLDGIYAQQVRILQHASDLGKEATEIAELTKNPRPPDVRLKPPHGLILLDQLYSQRDYLLRAKALLKTDVDTAATDLDEARDEFDAKERRRRAAKQAIAAPADLARAQGSLRLAELESRLAKETVLLCEIALDTLKLQQSLVDPKLAFLLPDFEWLLSHLGISEDDLLSAKTKQEKRLAELDTVLESARNAADQAAQLVVAAERQNTDESKSTGDELESRRADRQTVNLILSTLAAQRDRQAAFAEVLDLRRRTLGGAARSAEMKAWSKINNAELARLEKSRRPQLGELRKSRAELQDLQAKLADSPASSLSHAWTLDRVKHLATWIAVNGRELADLADLATARSRLKEELDVHVNTFSWHDSFASVKAGLSEAWSYEVFSVADQPIRIKTILAVVLLLCTGQWLSRRISDLIGRTVFHRLGMSTGHRAAWQTLSFYALFLIVLLVAINLVNLSLTQFSVVSGALAVGIGFGSQNLIGNFISGIILLLERPVNQGDVIEINGQQMTVERLGARSTLVRSRDNTHVIVPNSRLLEENVVNLTLSDDVIRTRIHVGVAYGSPTREVARLLEEVILGHESVKRDPAPLVLFAQFADSALNFEALFWSALEGRKDVESELRHRIAEIFSKAGIVMAFPQRDVHLGSSKPLQIELLPGKASESPAV